MDVDSHMIPTLEQENERLRERIAALEIERDEARVKYQWMYDLLEQTNIPICLWHGDEYTYQFANSAYLTRSRKHDVIGKPLREVFEEHDIPGLMPILDQAYASGEMQSVQEALVKLSDSETGEKDDGWFNLVYNPVRNGQGNVVGVSNFAVEVTAQVRTRQELHRQAQILDQVRGSVVVTDMDGIIVSVNQDTTRIFGYQPEEMLEKPVTMLYAPEKEEWLRNKVLTHLQTHDALEMETMALHKAGKCFPIQLSLSLLCDDNKAPIGIIGYTIDISERKRQEEALRQSQTLLQAVFDNVPVAIYVRDMQGRFTLVNQNHATAMGLPQEQIIGRYDHELFPPEAMKHIQTIDQHVLDTRSPVEEEESVPVADGWRTFISIRFPLCDDDGTIYSIGGISSDISERKQQEQDLHMFKALVDTVPDGIGIAAFGTSQIIYANPAHRAMFGYGDQIIGMPISDLSGDSPEFLARMVQEASEQGVWRGEIRCKRKDGTTFPVYISTIVLYGSDGQPYVAASIIRDLTEQKQAEAERMALQQQIINAQRETLRELSTPLIPLSDTVMIMPLIGTIDSGRAQQIMEALLEGVAQHQSELAILDITGVSIVDTQVAQTLISVAQAVKLLGAQVILTGIQPPIAQTLVHLGVDLSSITTRRSLQAGIAAAFH